MGKPLRITSLQSVLGGIFYQSDILRLDYHVEYDAERITDQGITIYNLDDHSFSISPEIVYTGFTNWEMCLRCTFREGTSFTEYGERLIRSKLELRLRYFF